MTYALRKYTPPMALRWLALRTDAETCEALRFAATAFERVNRPMKQVVEKAIGRGRMKNAIFAATDLGRACLFEAENREWLATNKEPASVEDAAKELNARASAGESALDIISDQLGHSFASRPSLLRLASLCLDTAITMEGDFGIAYLNLALVRLAQERFRESQHMSRVASEKALDATIRLFAKSNLICALVNAGRADLTLSVPIIDTNNIPGQQRFAGSIYFLNRAVAAAELGDSVALERHWSDARDLDDGQTSPELRKRSIQKTIELLGGRSEFRRVIKTLENLESVE